MKGKSKFNGSFIRSRGERVKTRDHRINRSFDQYSIKCGGTKKIYLVCNKIVMGTRRCDFSIRKDSYLDNPERYNSHKCSSIQIESYLKKKNEPVLETDQITTSIFEFVGVSKLSMSFATSDIFNDFLKSFIKLGQLNPTVDPQTLIPKITRKTFTKHFIKYSEEQFEGRLQLYKKIKGSCIAIDAGKHKSIPYLIVVLTNAMTDIPPLIVDVVRFFKGKSIDYSASVEKILTILINKGINIVAIVSDNLKSQTSAINHTSKNSMQQNTLIPKLTSIFWISCSVHTLALALNDAGKQCLYGEIIDHLRDTATFLRNKNVINMLGIKCPIWAPTRWTGMFDISFWILQNNEKIVETISASLKSERAYDIPDYIIDGFTEAAVIVFTILLPFNHAIHILESDRMPAAYTIPVVFEAISQMKSNCSILNISEEIVDCISENIIKRINFTQTGRILGLLYTLTPWGRKEIRESGQFEITGTDSIKLEKPFSNDLSRAEEAILNKIKDNPTLFHDQASYLKEAFCSYKGKLIDVTNSRNLVKHNGEIDYIEDDDDEEENIESDGLHISFIEKDTFESDTDDSEESYSDYSLYDDESDWDLADDEVDESTNGPLEDNITTLKNIATLQGFSEEESLKLVSQYGDWLLGNPSLILIHEEYLMKGHKCWQFYTSFKSIDALAKFSYPLMGIVASEATCERAFWQHRRIIGDQGMKTGVSLEKAKMFFASK